VVKKASSPFVVSAVVVGLAGMSHAQGMPPLPQPGPEHALYKDAAGTWDARVESFMGPGEPMVSTGVEVNRVGCGGLCLISDFEGSFMGTKFEGHGTDTWDPAKKKYVGSWTDSMSTGLSLTESTWDAAAQTLIGSIEGPDMMGNVVKMKSTTTIQDADHRVMEMRGPGPDGQETLVMRISYTRKK